tara:strand:+ start:204 stop:584 length:381 start_codon:yes stop_codon:yes gene_type:complete
MGERDVTGAIAHLSDGIIIRSPIFSTPFEGKADATKVLTHLLQTLDSFEPKLLLRDGADVVAIFTAKCGEHVIDGMDHLHLGPTGLIDSMTVAWRPLTAVVAVQQLLAPKLGEKAMQLVPINSPVA